MKQFIQVKFLIILTNHEWKGAAPILIKIDKFKIIVIKDSEFKLLIKKKFEEKIKIEDENA